MIRTKGLRGKHEAILRSEGIEPHWAVVRVLRELQIRHVAEAMQAGRVISVTVCLQSFHKGPLLKAQAVPPTVMRKAAVHRMAQDHDYLRASRSRTMRSSA